MLALTSPTGGGPSVGMVRSRTKATEFSLVYMGNTVVNGYGLIENRRDRKYEAGYG